MKIRTITSEEFNEFAKYSKFSNFHQTRNYALLKAEEGFDYEIIALSDDVDNIYAACVILFNTMGKIKYAYIPEGYIIDYSNEYLIGKFTDELYNYYKSKNIAFIKINPSVPIYEIDINTKERIQTEYYGLTKVFDTLGYKRLKDSMYFESKLPRLTCIKSLFGFGLDKVSKNTRNKYRKAETRGLVLEKVDSSKMDILNRFISNKADVEKYHYQDYVNIFSKTDDIDMFLVYIDYDKSAHMNQLRYDLEKMINEEYRFKVERNPKKNNINKKLNSDKLLDNYKYDITNSSNHLSDIDKTYVAGAIVVKNGLKATLLISGYDKAYSSYMPNYFLFYKLMDHYTRVCTSFDMNGVAGDFSKLSKYYGLNEFKFGFKPTIYEYIGEYDLILNKTQYLKLSLSGKLAKTFNKKDQNPEYE